MGGGRVGSVEGRWGTGRVTVSNASRPAAVGGQAADGRPDQRPGRPTAGVNFGLINPPLLEINAAPAPASLLFAAFFTAFIQTLPLLKEEDSVDKCFYSSTCNAASSISLDLWRVNSLYSTLYALLLVG